MSTNATVSLVFVGGEFSPSLINEHDFERYLGGLDAEGLLKVGPVGQYFYSSRKFQVSIAPDRIDLKGFNIDFLQEELISAAKAVIDVLTPVQSVVRVTGFGINCDTLFNQDEIGQTGANFCTDRLISPGSLSLVGGEPYTATTARYYFLRPPIRFDVRFEPHFGSEGRQLIVAVNGHQEVSQNVPLLEVLDAVPTVRAYVDGLHSRLIAREGKGQ